MRPMATHWGVWWQEEHKNHTSVSCFEQGRGAAVRERVSGEKKYIRWALACLSGPGDRLD
jgi:hypothetical protein